MGLRILYNSQDGMYKQPFGVLKPMELCAMTIAIPASCQTTQVELVLQWENGAPFRRILFAPDHVELPYEYYRVEFSLQEPGLFFYYFYITTKTGGFRLFKYGEDTNMEAGDLWQLSCVAQTHAVPEAFQGRVFYQVFPDRFYQEGQCDCTEKLQPYWVHNDPGEMPVFRPNEKGEVLNNDFYGGNLNGIRAKLPYLKELGVGAIYLNPIFMAFSSHRYDTADYKRIDPMLGTEADFAALCEEAHKLDIKIILDGVFSHTGSNSVYFDDQHIFGGGAVSDPASPYRKWYQFQKYPVQYTSWWGFRTLPCINKLEPAFMDFIFGGEDSVIAKWLRLGADGFRLDVADELPDEFLMQLRNSMRKMKADALLVGEVWEDASNKIAYNVRRRYFVDNQLDSVMNYPWRKAILDFARGADDGWGLRRSIMSLAENYPADVLNANLNLLSSHDVARAITFLIDPTDGDREDLYRRMQNMTPEQLALGKKRYKLAAFLQFMLPGCPCVYYGDEAGMTGYRDPFNRQYYPWGKEDVALQAQIRSLARLRNGSDVLKRGTVRVICSGEGRIAFRRVLGDCAMTLWCNASSSVWDAAPAGRCVLGDLALPPMSFCAMEE